MKDKFFILLIIVISVYENGLAQKNDISSSTKDTSSLKGKLSDTTKVKVPIKKYDPGKASLYSAVVPGLGQIYNKKYWKLPLVYAGLGIPVYTYLYNRSWYNKTRYALAVVKNNSAGNADSLAAVDPKLLIFVQLGDATDLIKYRNEFRQDEDYSVLFFLLFYALQIVDATVDAHLKEFNVSDDLSLELKPTAMPASGISLGLALDFHKARQKPIFDNR